VEAGFVGKGRDGAAVVGGDGAAGVADEEGEVEGVEEGGRDDGWVRGGVGGGGAVGGAVGFGGGVVAEGRGDAGGFLVRGEEIVGDVFDKDAFSLWKVSMSCLFMSRVFALKRRTSLAAGSKIWSITSLYVTSAKPLFFLASSSSAYRSLSRSGPK
jgi:hypothetical protein